ncbi:MAG: radical SAM family heme chaperone HemW [Gammaproteobacteria bacterium]
MIETAPPLSLYIHLPWCVRKCPYCDFNSYRMRASVPEYAYIRALLSDLNHSSSLVDDRVVQSIFMGGGTPSLFSGEAICTLLDGVRGSLKVGHDAEITLEANPGTAEAHRFEAYREAGVNRLSLGVQSFRPEKLASLGRIHSGREAGDAFQLGRQAGFDNINIDLMYGLPEDTVEGSIEDVEHALALAPEHLSWYQLTLEPNTPFYRQPPPLPDEDIIAEIEQRGWERLRDSGFQHYEVSAYAKPGLQCRHNRNYWEFGDYLGLGAGAHGKISLPEKRVILRQGKRQPSAYIKAAGTPDSIETQYELTAEDLIVEFMMNALRLTQGFTKELFTARTGLPLGVLNPALDLARQRGLLAVESERMQATAKGRLFLDNLLQFFYPEPGQGIDTQRSLGG